MKKKLLILGLIILGFGGYLISQNMWIFEENISVENYFEILENSTWVDKNGAIWIFKNENLTIYENIDNSNIKKRGYSENIEWNISNEKLLLKFSYDYVLQPWEVINFTKNFIQIQRGGKIFSLKKVR